jgi:hypothetical protein
MTDPISRLQFGRQEIDRVFGDGYAAGRPDVVVMRTDGDSPAGRGGRPRRAARCFEGGRMAERARRLPKVKVKLSESPMSSSRKPISLKSLLAPPT